jgi:phage repressor protein C with HTH and peptisase S24 domain
MTDSNERLRQARERAGFTSARSAALRFGWIPSTYASHENGQTPVPVKDAPRYGRAFKVSAAWLLTGEGSLKARNIVKVIGLIGAGAEITPEAEQVPPEGLAEVEVPFPVPEDAIAFEVQGESMYPRYDHGDIVLCRNRERDPADLIGFEAAVRTTAGHRYLKRLRRGARKGIFDLESFNAELIRGVRIAWASEVHSVVRAGQWRALNDAGKRRLLGGAPA